jgi:hypothetical protein
MTLAELGQRMSQAEFVQWRAFYVWEAAMIEFQRNVTRARCR